MPMRRVLVFLAASVFMSALLASAQDEPSLGDVARQARQQKQQKDAQTKDSAGKDSQTPSGAAGSKDAQGKDAASAAAPKDASAPKTAHVITNDEIPSHVGPTGTRNSPVTGANYQSPSPGNRGTAEQWKSAILQLKNSIEAMQSQLNQLNESIHYAGGNCVSGCVQWNERQKQKQDQAEGMKAQIEEQQKRLEELQDQARQQGFGSSVYDP